MDQGPRAFFGGMGFQKTAGNRRFREYRRSPVRRHVSRELLYHRSTLVRIGAEAGLFPSTPFQASASPGGSSFCAMLGQILLYWALSSSQFGVARASVSGKIALAGYSGSQTPQSMHSSG